MYQTFLVLLGNRKSLTQTDDANMLPIYVYPLDPKLKVICRLTLLTKKTYTNYFTSTFIPKH